MLASADQLTCSVIRGRRRKVPGSSQISRELPARGMDSHFGRGVAAEFDLKEPPPPAAKTFDFQRSIVEQAWQPPVVPVENAEEEKTQHGTTMGTITRTTTGAITAASLRR